MASTSGGSEPRLLWEREPAVQTPPAFTWDGEHVVYSHGSTVVKDIMAIVNPLARAAMRSRRSCVAMIGC